MHTELTSGKTEMGDERASPAEAIGSLHRTAEALPGCALYLLLHPSGDLSPRQQGFREALRQLDLTPQRLRIKGLPERMAPEILALDTSRPSHWHAAALSIELAHACMTPKVLRLRKPQPINAWIFSSHSEAEVAKLIAKAATWHVAENKRNRWFRFYDPLVLDLAIRNLGEGQMKNVLTGVRCWVFLNRWKALQLVEPSLSEKSTRIAAADWKKMAVIGPLNHAWINALARGAPMGHSEIFELHDVLVSENAAEFLDAADLDYFTDQSVRLGISLGRHPEVKELLARASSSGGYAKACQSKSVDFWERIAAETQQMHIIGSP